MITLTEADFLNQLLAPKKGSTASKKQPNTPGYFLNTAGVMKRSRKGRSYRKGGSVKYIPTLEQWQRAGLCKKEDKLIQEWIGWYT